MPTPVELSFHPVFTFYETAYYFHCK